MPGKVWDEITYPFSNFNGATVEVCKWISNFIPHFIMDVITCPCWDWSWPMLVKGPPECIHREVLSTQVISNYHHATRVQSLKFVLDGPIDNKLVLIQMVACRLSGAKPLFKPTLTCFTRAYMRHSALMSWAFDIFFKSELLRMSCVLRTLPSKDKRRSYNWSRLCMHYQISLIYLGQEKLDSF